MYKWQQDLLPQMSVMLAIEFKKAYVNAKAEDIKIINSPVGMPGRAICNNFIKRVEKKKNAK